jgi:hypothetical protein
MTPQPHQVVLVGPGDGAQNLLRKEYTASMDTHNTKYVLVHQFFKWFLQLHCPNIFKICKDNSLLIWLRLDRSTARYIYKAKNGKLLVVLTPSQKTKLIFEQYIQTLFNKDCFQTIKY